MALKSPNKRDVSKLSEYDKMIDISCSYLSAFQQLLEAGYVPDVVVSHIGWGCGIHVRDVWPNSFIVAYHEWWFSKNLSLRDGVLCKTSWMHNSFLSAVGSYTRNALMAYQMCCADVIVTPTLWQVQTLPKLLQTLSCVCFDGVDTGFYFVAKHKQLYQEFQNKPLILTYGTRGMEAIRGFPDFVYLIKQLLTDNFNVMVKIAGLDETNYFHSPPPYCLTWGEWAHAELETWIISGNVEFVGRLSPLDYRAFLQNSDLHFYLSVDFVPSWSLFDAMACGCTIISWNTLSLQTIIDPDCLCLCAPCDADSLLATVKKCLLDGSYRLRKSQLARKESLNYSIENCMRRWGDILATKKV